MTIGGVSMILILGIINMILLSFQASSGLRWIQVSFIWHRRTGVFLFLTALSHGVLAILAH